MFKIAVVALMKGEQNCHDFIHIDIKVSDRNINQKQYAIVLRQTSYSKFKDNNCEID